MPEQLSWEHVYLLGWYDETGKAYLTTWEGDLPVVHVVVTGVRPLQMPLWGAPVPPNARLHSIPEHIHPSLYVSHATWLGGYHAFGWCLGKTIERTVKGRHAAG